VRRRGRGAPVTTETNGNGGNGAGSGFGVLVVDDDPEWGGRMARMLSVGGSRVVVTSSGDGALALMAQWPVDVVLVDEELSGTSGFDLTRRIRESHGDIPVVMMTGHETTAVTEAAEQAGAIACMTKPFNFDALAALLESLPRPAA